MSRRPYVATPHTDSDGGIDLALPRPGGLNLPRQKYYEVFALAAMFLPFRKPLSGALHPSNYQPAKEFRFWLFACPVESEL
jgi:hypothetical protein